MYMNNILLNFFFFLNTLLITNNVFVNGMHDKHKASPFSMQVGHDVI